MLWSVVLRFSFWKALMPSRSNTPSFSSSSKQSAIRWRTVSQPARWPPQRFHDPRLSVMSLRNAWTMVLPMIRLGTSPMPIGLTPSFFSKGRRRQARKASRLAGSTCIAQSLLAAAANASRRARELGPKERSCFFQFSASPPDGPWDPFVFSAALLIASAVMTSKITGWGGSGGSSFSSKAASTTGAGSNCSALRASTTSSVSLRTPPVSSSRSSKRRASCIRSWKTRLANLRCKGTFSAFSLPF